MTSRTFKFSAVGEKAARVSEREDKFYEICNVLVSFHSQKMTVWRYLQAKQPKLDISPLPFSLSCSSDPCRPPPKAKGRKKIKRMESSEVVLMLVSLCTVSKPSTNWHQTQVPGRNMETGRQGARGHVWGKAPLLERVSHKPGGQVKSRGAHPQPHPESKRALFALSQPFCTFQPPAGDRISWPAYLGSLSIMTTSWRSRIQDPSFCNILFRAGQIAF